MTIKNLAGTFLIDAEAAFLNGAGLGEGEDKNVVIPKSYRIRVDNRTLTVPYVSAQAWRRWLRNTCNEENGWVPSVLQAIGESEKGSTNKISTELNPISYEEDDLFGYMRSGKGKEESVQRTSPFKSSVLRGIEGRYGLERDEGFVHLQEGTPLPYTTKFYATHLEAFFNLEAYRLGIYQNRSSRVELAEDIIKSNEDKLEVETKAKNHKIYTLKDNDTLKEERIKGLLKGLVFLRGGAKQAAYNTDVAPKAILFAALDTANPIFNDLFSGKSEKPFLKIDLLKQIRDDYADKLAGDVYIGLRSGYLENEEEVKALGEGYKIGSPVQMAKAFVQDHLNVEW